LIGSTLLAEHMGHHIVLITLALAAAVQADDRCAQGYLWREAFSGDHVCVTPESRQRAADDNRRGAVRHDRSAGPDVCSQGFVWREARPSDRVCVPPATRADTASENRLHVSRLAGAAPGSAPAPAPPPAPPPAAPAPAPPPPSIGPPAVAVVTAFRRTTSAVAALKGVEAMGIKQNFIHAQAKDGDANGYDENSFVIVHTVEIGGGVQIFVAAFNPNPSEAERLRDVIGNHVIDGPYNSRVSQAYDTSDRSRMQTRMGAYWSNFDKVATLATAGSCAHGAMAQNGLSSKGNDPQIAYGFNGTTRVAVFNVGGATRTQVLVIAVSTDSSEAERLRNRVKASIVGCAPL
jgi:hypothetical protein